MGKLLKKDCLNVSEFIIRYSVNVSGGKFLVLEVI